MDGSRLVDQVTEEELVLLVQGAPGFVDSLHDHALDVVAVPNQCLELLDESVRVHLIDVVAVLGQSHLAHQRRALVMKRDRDDRLVEEQAHQDVMEPRCDHEVGRPELQEQLVDGADRVIRDALVGVGREAFPQHGSEVVDDEGVCVAEQELDVVVVVEQPAHEDGERLQVPIVGATHRIGDAVLSGVLHQAETDDGSSLAIRRRR